MADVTYQPDYRGVAELMRTPEMHAVLHAVAEEAIPFAKAISPDAPPLDTGYITKFEVEAGEHTDLLAGSRRAVARLYNTSEYAAAVEWGWSQAKGQWGDHAGYHVLALTADHIAGT